MIGDIVLDFVQQCMCKHMQGLGSNHWSCVMMDNLEDCVFLNECNNQLSFLLCCLRHFLRPYGNYQSGVRFMEYWCIRRTTYMILPIHEMIQHNLYTCKAETVTIHHVLWKGTWWTSIMYTIMNATLEGLSTVFTVSDIKL